MTWATDRLDLLKARAVTPPPVVETLRLGLLDDWGPGWARKVWTPEIAVLNGDGSLFGGYVAALADQILAFATMTVVPDGMAFRTVNLAVRFVKVGRDAPLAIEGRVVAQSRNLITVEADFRQNDILIARADAQQMLAPLAG
jgi:acyl-coenzyme A thioesterase PaaI-like protein